MSLVARLEGEVARRLAEVLDEVRRRQRGSHYVYSAEDLHITVRSLEGYQRVIPAAVVDSYIGQISASLAGMGAFRVSVRGLGASSAGLLARGYPDPALSRVRAGLHRAAMETGPFGVPGADAERIRDIAHVSLSVFQQAGVPEPGLVGLVDEARATRYGSMLVRALSLVRYDWSGDSMTMTDLATLQLGQQPRKTRV